MKGHGDIVRYYTRLCSLLHLSLLKCPLLVIVICMKLGHICLAIVPEYPFPRFLRRVAVGAGVCAALPSKCTVANCCLMVLARCATALATFDGGGRRSVHQVRAHVCVCVCGRVRVCVYVPTPATASPVCEVLRWTSRILSMGPFTHCGRIHQFETRCCTVCTTDERVTCVQMCAAPRTLLSAKQSRTSPARRP